MTSSTFVTLWANIRFKTLITWHLHWFWSKHCHSLTCLAQVATERNHHNKWLVDLRTVNDTLLPVVPPHQVCQTVPHYTQRCHIVFLACPLFMSGINITSSKFISIIVPTSSHPSEMNTSACWSKCHCRRNLISGKWFVDDHVSWKQCSRFTTMFWCLIQESDW